MNSFLPLMLITSLTGLLCYLFYTLGESKGYCNGLAFSTRHLREIVNSAKRVAKSKTVNLPAHSLSTIHTTRGKKK